MDEEIGFCGNLLKTMAVIRSGYTPTQIGNVLLACYKTWPKWSGSKGYPVPAEVEGVTPCYAYTMTENKWKPGPYNDLRRELIDHITNVVRDVLFANPHVLKSL